MTERAPLLSTKLHAPSGRDSRVRRERLTQRLSGRERLVLAAAPAGFGKTSVLAEWLDDVPGRVAWLSLDERDDDPAQFWPYVLAAVDSAREGLARGAAEALANGSPTEAALATLLNDIQDQGDEIFLVLDDLHVIRNPAIFEGIAFLLDHLPANARLVIATRVDPPLPVARLRAKGELVELRAADLRFTPSEISQYVNGAMGLSLESDDLLALGDRTEGWIAALQLAALSLQGRSDASRFISRFAGDDRFVVDYLIEEVLQRQPEANRSFLLATSVLERLSGALCDAVTEGDGAASMLDSLDRANLFLVPLDDHREWYRYHHLFAEMLRARLLDEQPGAVDELHLRASRWFEQHGDIAEAIEHSLEARDFQRAAGMIKSASPAMQRQRQEVTLATWYARLPSELVRADPELGIGFAGALLSSGRTDGVEDLLREAELTAGSVPEGVQDIRRGIALYGAAQALTRGDLARALEQSRIAVELSVAGSPLDRGSSHGIRGLVLWSMGDLEGARAEWELSLRELESAGHLSDVLGGSIAMGEILITLGRLGEAEETYRRGVSLGRSTEPPLRGTADVHVGLADVLRERGDLEGARSQLVAAEALGEYAGLPQNRHRRRMVTARVLQAEHDLSTAIALLEEAESLYTPDFFPEVRPIRSLRTRMLLAAGRLDDARANARRRDRPPIDDLPYLAEFDDITTVRILLAEGSPVAADSATELLDRLLLAAERGRRWGVVVELLVLRALAARASGRADDALPFLSRAVELAEPEGFVRSFADEGESIAQLLAVMMRGGGSAFVRTLHAAASGRGIPRPSATGVLLPDPLSEREMEVLRLLASDSSGPEIARHLVVSVNTLRTHTKSIYAKLGATSRRQAVTRATELGLLKSPR